MNFGAKFLIQYLSISFPEVVLSIHDYDSRALVSLFTTMFGLLCKANIPALCALLRLLFLILGNLLRSKLFLNAILKLFSDI